MENVRVKFGYLSRNEMFERVSDGRLNEYDIVFTKDTFETYIISENLTPISLKSKVYTFNSRTAAIQQLNKNTDTYEGQIVSIANGDIYEGYIVNKVSNSYTVTPLSLSSSIDYDTLGNKPIVNLVGESDNPLIISSLNNGTYSISGHFKIANNDVTTHLNPNVTIFIIENNDDVTFIKEISTKEIVDYEVTNEHTTVVEQYITNEFLKENGYATTSYVDGKIVALDFIRREEMFEYVDGIFKSFVDEQLIPIVDDRIDKKIIGATEKQIHSLFEN